MTDALTALRSLFIERCRKDLSELDRLHSEADAQEMGVIIHRLAGAAGSFGFPELSECALAVDQHLRDGHEATRQEFDELRQLLRHVQDQA